MFQECQACGRSVPCPKLAYDAVQELRIRYRWEVLDAEARRWPILESREPHMNPSCCLMETRSNSYWLDPDTSCSSIQADGPKTRNNELNSCSYGFPN
ncbi:Uncharacterised protein [Sphingobacterium multivorum]|uniref:Uncharacterized protein n=1 Tax=Sphingobacterium multivorum TaxID=28454 RepID=A0A2X2IWV3_SPHMU|nr:Uncharacterised protein [Sphingobacterium multivorum]